MDLDLARIVEDLKKERDRINRAIGALEGLGSGKPAAKRSASPASNSRGKTQKRGQLTPEGRKRLSDLMKKRWAQRRRRKG